MKKIFLIIAIAFIKITFINAQIDRSQQPIPGPTPEINIGDPQIFTAENGIKVLVVENNKLPRVSVSLRIDNSPKYYGDKVGVASLLGSLMGKGTKNIPMDEFFDEVDFMGAGLDVGSSGGSANSLTRYFPRVFEMFADAVINPNFTEEEFVKERDELITGLKAGENSVQTVASRIEDLLTYGANHPYGEYISEESVNRVTLDDIKTLYRTLFDVNKAYLVFVGDITLEKAKDLTNTHFGQWSSNLSAVQLIPRPVNVASTTIEFVDMPNAVQSEIAVNSTTEISKKDPDFFAVLTANQILGGGADARLFLNLREDKGYTYGAYSSYSFDHDTAERFSASTSVRNAVTDSAVVQILYELDKLKNQDVEIDELDRVKAKYLGSFVRSLENPSNIANYAYNIITEGLPEDFYRTYLQNIQKVSVEDVKRVASKYFPSDRARVVVTGKGSEILENLEKIEHNGNTVTVNYYDKWGNPIPRPDYDNEIDSDVTVESILEKYFEAVGGRETVDNIHSFKSVYTGIVQGLPLRVSVSSKIESETNLHKLFVDVEVSDNPFQKILINGDTGYMILQGQLTELSSEEIENEQLRFVGINIGNLLSYSDVELVGLAEVDGDPAYELKPTVKSSFFFDVNTNLISKTTYDAELGNGQPINIESVLSDYREVNGLLVPHTIVTTQMGTSLEINLDSIEFNLELDDSLFEYNMLED